MSALTLTVWSMALGAIAAVAGARLGELLARRSRTQLRAVGYHAAVFLLVLVESGVLRQVARPGAPALHVLQVLAGPVCVGVANFWIHGWLAASQRDPLMAAALRLSSLALPLLALAVFALPHEQQIPAAGALALAGGALTCWLTFRAWIIGDRLALAMALGCLFTLPALAGLYALAMGLGHWSAGAQALVALAAALSNGLTGAALSQRERQQWRTRDSGSAPAIDPVTRVHSCSALVQRLVEAQKRRRRTRREGALVAVIVFDADRVAAQVGVVGLDEAWMTLAARLQRHVGVVNPVGRYWDRCFVALVETLPSPAALRTLSLRVAASLRQPVEVTGRGGEPVRVRLDAGVGAVRLAPLHGEVEDALDQAQRLAEAARGMRSRAALADPASGAPVAAETVRWPAPRPAPRGAAPARMMALHRAAR